MENQNGSAKLAKQKEIAKKVYEAFESGKTTDLGNYVANDLKEHIPDPAVKSTGIQFLKDQIELYHSAFPDMKIKINEAFGDGERLTVYVTVSGTNTGSLLGISATNKKVTVNSIDIFKFKDEKITEHWGIYDGLSMMTQLGVVPALEELAKQEAETQKK